MLKDVTKLPLDKRQSAAYGGPGWTARTMSLQDDIGTVWSDFSLDSEWAPLRAVLLHRPGVEMDVPDADRALMLDKPDVPTIQRQHDAVADAYRAHGITVHYVEPSQLPPPNQVFVADVMFMTRFGAIVGRPASTVRAGEERWVARRLADLGVPILRTVGGTGTFEGADALWLNPRTVMVGLGPRTNQEGATQVANALREYDVNVVFVDVPRDAMHLMGAVRVMDGDLAFVHADHLTQKAVAILQQHGLTVRSFPSEAEMHLGMGHNVVTLGPRRILMPAGNPETERSYRDAGVDVTSVDIGEVTKAAGGIGCMTGILARQRMEES